MNIDGDKYVVEEDQTKKHQFLLSACILCFTALIFMACIAFTVETNRFTKEYFAYGNEVNFYIPI